MIKKDKLIWQFEKDKEMRFHPEMVVTWMTCLLLVCFPKWEKKKNLIFIQFLAKIIRAINQSLSQKSKI